VPDEGYEIYEWYINGEPLGTTESSIAYVMLDEETTVEVQFVVKTNSLSFGTPAMPTAAPLSVTIRISPAAVWCWQTPCSTLPPRLTRAITSRSGVTPNWARALYTTMKTRAR